MLSFKIAYCLVHWALPVYAMSTAAGTATAEYSVAVEAVHAHRFVGMMVAKADISPVRMSQVSKQVDDCVTICFHLCAIIK